MSIYIYYTHIYIYLSIYVSLLQKQWKCIKVEYANVFEKWGRKSQSKLVVHISEQKLALQEQEKKGKKTKFERRSSEEAKMVRRVFDGKCCRKSV